MTTPAQIGQTYLDRVSAAVMRGDYADYRRCVALPLHMITHAANLTVTTEEQLRSGFDTFRALLHSQRVTDYIRLVDSAAQLGSGLLSVRYVTHLVAGSLRIMPPFQSQMSLREGDGIWRAVSLTNGLSSTRWPLEILRLADPAPQFPDHGDAYPLANDPDAPQVPAPHVKDRTDD